MVKVFEFEIQDLIKVDQAGKTKEEARMEVVRRLDRGEFEIDKGAYISEGREI